MTSILEEFAYGNLSSQAYLDKDAQYRETAEIVLCNERKLREKLGAEYQSQLETYLDMQHELIQLTAVKNLMYGYQLGLLMTSEAFITSGDLVR